jgi:hypothetical protein
MRMMRHTITSTSCCQQVRSKPTQHTTLRAALLLPPTHTENAHKAQIQKGLGSRIGEGLHMSPSDQSGMGAITSGRCAIVGCYLPDTLAGGG